MSARAETLATSAGDIMVEDLEDVSAVGVHKSASSTSTLPPVRINQEWNPLCGDHLIQ